MNLADGSKMPRAGIGGEYVINPEIVACRSSLFCSPVDVAEPIVGHVNFKFPRTVFIGNRHERLSFFHRPENQSVSHLPGHDHAIDWAFDFQIRLLAFVELTLFFKACDLSAKLGSTTGETGALIGRKFVVFKQRSLRADKLFFGAGLASKNIN